MISYMAEKEKEARRNEIYDEWRHFLDFWLAHPGLTMGDAVELYETKPHN